MGKTAKTTISYESTQYSWYKHQNLFKVGNASALLITETRTVKWFHTANILSYLLLQLFGVGAFLFTF